MRKIATSAYRKQSDSMVRSKLINASRAKILVEMRKEMEVE